MDNMNNSSNFGGGNLEEPTSFGSEQELDKPISFEGSDDADQSGISHAPLNLGGDSTAKAPAVKPKDQPVKPARGKPPETASSRDRITAVKTFFTKLHAGAIDFLDEQISGWLQKNPDIVIKRTNTATGEVQGKKVEPNIIVTIWY